MSAPLARSPSPRRRAFGKSVTCDNVTSKSGVRLKSKLIISESVLVPNHKVLTKHDQNEFHRKRWLSWLTLRALASQVNLVYSRKIFHFLFAVISKRKDVFWFVAKSEKMSPCDAEEPREPSSTFATTRYLFAHNILLQSIHSRSLLSVRRIVPLHHTENNL